ncbi:hypothetical protein [Nostoc sp. CMAA1605]|uniref:hypothetical protein n=1 Tax=Nostoc sp. CMAA1605 TaxID=2055159 RepID=UPI001F164474|nr:hypothetical protein [Nostoc sp. CMAA1605]MCF4968506.1 hypothetical protein [Nostoc sp. CMAA1605]
MNNPTSQKFVNSALAEKLAIYRFSTKHSPKPTDALKSDLIITAIAGNSLQANHSHTLPNMKQSLTSNPS